ncbi:hypothetical protein [Mesorhizobium sp. CAU 1732]|uniref:hypothetical protein n=1 Tax=Mesorhizobium sp. CAU 1732 TaxID=3140358 RepID=UPI00326131E1
MKKFITVAGVAAALALSAGAAHAGGWGNKGHNNYSSGLINVSPTVRTGDLNVLSGILNNSPILSGNSILSGNNTGIGILGSATGLLSNIIKAPAKNRGGRR